MTTTSSTKLASPKKVNKETSEADGAATANQEGTMVTVVVEVVIEAEADEAVAVVEEDEAEDNKHIMELRSGKMKYNFKCPNIVACWDNVDE